MIFKYMFPGGAWKEAAAALGIKFEKCRAEYWEAEGKVSQNELVLSGNVRGVRVYVTTYRGGHGRYDGNDGFSLATIGRSETASCMRMMASSDSIPANLRLVREGMLSKLGQALVGQDIEVGDPAFDSAVVVEGTDVEVVALLGAQARAVLAGAVGSGKYQVTSGRVENERPECIVDADRLVAEVNELVHVAQYVCLQPGSMQERLAYNAEHDPVPAVRQRNHALLTQAFGSHAQDPRLEALHDSNPRVAFNAAVELGAHGFPTIVKIADHPEVAAELRAEALRYAAMRMPRDESVPLLERHLSDAGPPLHVAVEGLGYLRHRAVTEYLVRLAYSADAKLLRAILQGLEYMGDPACEGMLVELMRHDELELRLRALRLLGQLGTNRAIAALMPFAEAEPDEFGQVQAARDAIHAIRLRPAASSGAR